MPELPEVETTLRGIRPYAEGRRIEQVIIRESRLREPIPAGIIQQLTGQYIKTFSRRGKYLLGELTQGTLLIHLGMSGSLRVVPTSDLPQRHDQVDLVLNDGLCLRFHDPRRFGLLLWTPETPAVAKQQHRLLCKLGPEPLEKNFSGAYLYACSQTRRSAIKVFLMDPTVVVGIGNIYASEALFLAGIHPARPCYRVDAQHYQSLAEIIITILQAAIVQGGTTVRDFVNAAGQPGYFAQSLRVYGRAGLACSVCQQIIQRMQIGQRTSDYCPNCQHI